MQRKPLDWKWLPPIWKLSKINPVDYAHVFCCIQTCFVWSVVSGSIFVVVGSGSVVFWYSPDKHGRSCVPIEATPAECLPIWRFPTFSHMSHGAGWYSNTWDKAYLIINYDAQHLLRVEGNIQSEGIYNPIHPYSRQWYMIILLSVPRDVSWNPCLCAMKIVKINPSLLMMKECDIPHHYQYERRESMGHTVPI